MMNALNRLARVDVLGVDNLVLAAIGTLIMILLAL